MAQAQRNYYTNPAFCQQSEFYNGQNQQKIRHEPVGAQATTYILDTSNRSNTSGKHIRQKSDEDDDNNDEEDEYEQRFYEEMYVDDSGVVQQKNVLVVSSPNQKTVKNRYEYIQLSEHSKKPVQQIVQNGNPVRYHRYAVIHTPTTEAETEIKSDLPPTPPAPPPTPKTPSGRYALVPVEEVDANTQNRYAVITDEDIKQADQSITNTHHRYEYIADPPEKDNQQKPPPNQQVISPTRKIPANPIATQKLHELLSTPTRRMPLQTPTHDRSQSLVMSPNRNHPKSNNLLNRSYRNVRDSVVSPPRAQQKLNYSLGSRISVGDKRTMAIVAPVCSSAVQPVYNEVTYSPQKSSTAPRSQHTHPLYNRPATSVSSTHSSSESWMNMSGNASRNHHHRPTAAIQTTMSVAACMMVLCGTVTCALCFYMMSVMGRMYYLDFGTVAGFCCLMLGLMGCRGRELHFLPNRHYISGYIVLSVFSLGTCACLLVLLFMQPRPGTPLADLTSGAVCGVSALSLVVAAVGIISSYCCRYPPPDNRVEHFARGFTV